VFFRDIIGHQDIKERLIKTVEGNRISHAQLFTGPEGNGKLSLAIAYAQFLSCTNKKSNDSCGECPSCKKFLKLIHPDLHFVFPVIKKDKKPKAISDDFLKEWREFIIEKQHHSFNSWLNYLGAENQQASIYSDESQEIIKKLNLKTYEAEYKIMIIWMPEKMNDSAANKLLKMIEEPPQKTLFLLVSDDIEQIIRTIRSRTQLLKIPKIDNESLYNHLREKYDFDEKKINEIVRLSDGNYLKTQKIINSSENEDKIYFEKFSTLMRNSFMVKVPEMTEWADEMSALGRERQKIFLVYSLRMLRENFILNQSPENKDKIVFLADNEITFSNNFSKYIHANNITQLNQEFNEALKHIERNGFDKLIFLDLALKTTKLLKINPQQ